MAEDPAVERFDDHPAREQLRSVIRRTNKMLSESLSGLNEDNAIRLRRLHLLLAYANGIIERTDPVAAGTGALDTLKPMLDQIDPHTVAAESGNFGMMKAALQQAEQILPQLYRFPPKTEVDASAEFEAVTSKIRAAQSGILASAIARGAAAVEKTVSDAQAASQEVTRLTNDANNLRKNFEQLQQQIGQQSARLDAALATFSTNSASLEQQREQRFQDATIKQAEGFKGQADAEIAKVTNLLTDSETAASTALGNLDQKQKQAAQILNVIGNIGTTGNYKLTADANEKTANSLRTGAVALFLAMVVTVVVITLNLVQDGMNWQVAAFRLFSALILALPAAYLARESARHREVAERMRRMELELASIDAFNALLPEEQRNAIKGEMARRYFGNVAAEIAKSVSPDEQMTLKEFFKEMSSLVKAFRK